MRLKGLSVRKFFLNKNKKTLFLLGFLLLLLLVILYQQSYAYFSVNHKKVLIDSQINDGNFSDLDIDIFINGVSSNKAPIKSEMYKFDQINCTGGANGIWDNNEWKLTLTEMTRYNHCSLYFSGISTLKEIILKDNTVITDKPDFTTTSSEEDTGLYKGTDELADEYGDTYYFRGTKTILNNNLLFANHQWKILRINGDGSVRLLYNGTCPNNNCIINSIGDETQIGNSSYNQNNDRIFYVGWMYGSDSPTYSIAHANTNNSDAKATLDTWYRNNIDNQSVLIKNLIVDNLFCNDRSLKDGVSKVFAGEYRLRAGSDNGNFIPTLKCTNTQGSVPATHDQFTVSIANGIGNGALTYPVGLVTGDELNLAGYRGMLAANCEQFVCNDKKFWTMTPARFTTIAYVFDTYSNFLYASYDTTSPWGIRPVLSIKGTIENVIGNGSESNPYIVG